MEQEEYVLSLDSYSKEIETKIDIIISLRSKITSIETLEHFIKDKTQIIQSLFETEDLLRNSCLFLRKNYFKHKKSLLIGTIAKDYESYFLDSFPVFSTINPTDNKLIKIGFSECGTVDIQQPISSKDKEDIISKGELDLKNDSFLYNCQQETISYQLSTDKDNLGILTENIIAKEDKSPFKANNENNFKIDYLDSIKQRNNEYQDYLSYMKIKMNLNIEPIKLESKNHNEEKDNLNDVLVCKQSRMNTSSYSEHNRGIKEDEGKSRTNQSGKQIRMEKSNEKEVIINNKCSIIVKNNNTPPLIKKDESKIGYILMKLNSNKALYDMIVILFNKNILNQLMETPTNQTLLESVEKSIKEIEYLQEKDNKREILPQQNKQIPLNSNYLSFRNKNTKSYHQKKTKKNSQSCSIIENRHEGIIGLNESLNNSLNKKSSFADDLLANNGFASRRKAIACNNNKKIVNLYQLHNNKLNKLVSSISSDHYESCSITHNKSIFKKSSANSSSIRANKLIKQVGKNSAVKQYSNSSLKAKCNSSNKHVQNNISINL